MVAALDDLSVVQDHDGVAVADGGQAVGDDEYGPACIRLSIPFCTMLSVRVSMLEVASSSISTGGLATAALAIARS